MVFLVSNSIYWQRSSRCVQRHANTRSAAVTNATARDPKCITKNSLIQRPTPDDMLTDLLTLYFRLEGQERNNFY